MAVEKMTAHFNEQPIQMTSNPYAVVLKKVNGIQFTQREGDVLACLTSGLSLKGIAQLLNIHYKTLEVHMGNIRQKLGYSARDYIVEALEKSPEHPLLKHRYQQIQQLKTFQEILKNSQKKEALQKFIIFYTPATKKAAQYLCKEMNGSVPVKVAPWTPEQEEAHPHIVLADQPSSTSSSKQNILCLQDIKGTNTLYYQTLKTLEGFMVFSKDLSTLLPPKTESLESINIPQKKFFPRWLWGVAILLIGLQIFNYFTSSTSTVSGSQFLKRPSLLHTVEHALKSMPPHKNPVVALVGPGGIGKTTTARSILESNAKNLCWEINGESRITLINGYIALAMTLAQRFKTQSHLDAILAIKQVEPREKKLFSFLQRHLQKTSWIVLFDNVEDGKDIYSYVPLDSHLWGKGKILITTRDQLKTPRILGARVIEVPLLNAKEKFDLFASFCGKARKNPKEAVQFLTHIPPFPLDVSLAASYLNAIDISYERYLKLLQLSSNDFNRLQASLHYQGGYQITRYQIIRRSLESIIENDPLNNALTLLCCLVDAEAISQRMLEEHISKEHARTFIQRMQTHSLLKVSQTNHTLFMHRSTQHHGLVYLGDVLSSTLLDSLVTKVLETLETMTPQVMQEQKSQILTFLRHLESFKKKLKTLPITPTLEEKVRLQLNMLRAHIYDRALSHVQKVKSLLLKALTLNQEIQLLSKGQQLKCFMNLGRMYGLSGEFYEAIHSYKKALKIAKSEQKPEHVSKSLIAIGFEYVWLNEFKKSKQYLFQGLDTLKKLPDSFPQKQKLMAMSYSYLGTLYSTTFLDKREGYEQSLHYLQKAQDIMESLHDLNYLLRIYRNKTQTYCRAGLYKEALLEGIQPARKILEKIPAPSHTLLRLILDTCEGEILLRQGNVQQAKTILERTVLKYQDILGDGGAFMCLHPLVHYVEALMRTGKHKEALKFLEYTENMKNPAHTNFHKHLYHQLAQHKAALTSTLP